MDGRMRKETHVPFLERWAMTDSQGNERRSQFIPGAACVVLRWTGGPGLELEHLDARP